jgi:hypothetical protein
MLGPPVAGRDARPDEGRWTAHLRQKRVHYRRFDVATPEGSFVVEYTGQGMGDEWIHVDDQIVSQGHSTWWYTPYFEFPIGSSSAVLAVGYWPWLTVRWLKLIVDGRIVYSEGAAGQGLSADEVLAALSDPVVSDGVEIEGGLPASLPMLSSIVCEKQEEGIALTQHWFSWMSVATVPFSVFLGALVVGAYTLLPDGDLSVLSAVLLLPGILLALAVGYYSLARLVNSTVVTLTSGELSIRHGPLPWPGNRTVPVHNVKEFRCQRQPSRNYAGDVWETYTLNAVLDDGRDVELLHKIGSQGSADMLKQEVTAWLAG